MSSNKQRFDVFICYEKTTALDLARNLKESLKRCGIEAFVADIDIKKGETWEHSRDEALKECKHFVAIITNVALVRKEVEKEIDYAINANKKVVPCVEDGVSIELLKMKFPKLLDYQGIIGFKTSEELNRGVTNALIPHYLPKFVSEIINIHNILTDTKERSDESVELAKSMLKKFKERIEEAKTIKDIFDIFKEELKKD
ncbi:MAG: toll/interleukin-1 receptor domain-containing protein [Candidatus Methanospirareceae archaeon]